MRITRTVTYTAKQGGAVLGKAKVTLTAQGYGYVHDVHVDPGRRGRGIARALMRQLIADHDRIRLELIAGPRDATTDRDRLMTFYAGLGFRRGPSARIRNPVPSDQYRMFRNPIGSDRNASPSFRWFRLHLPQLHTAAAGRGAGSAQGASQGTLKRGSLTR